MKPPEKILPASDWEHSQLWRRVHDAIHALPAHFMTRTYIEGLLATDIFTLNSALAATIEEQVVATLNGMRAVWDPEKEYQSYAFVRQSQTFPDVLLRRKTNGQDIIMGIELKGWYLLAKEGMPNFRFTQSPDACAPADLIVIVPWVLGNVLSGSPAVLDPHIEGARHAAEHRNYYWEHERGTTQDAGIILAQGVQPYPKKSDASSDKAKSDSGGNFGRLARYGTMKDYIERTKATEIRGIPAKEWLGFFRKFGDKS